MNLMETVSEANSLFYNGKYKEALSLYYKILAEDLSNSYSYYSIGLVYDVLKDYELAISYYKKSIDLDSNNIRSINNLARIYIDVIKNFDIAKIYLNQAIKVSPQDAEAYNLYGNLWILNNDYDLAIKYLKKSISLDEKYFKNYYDIAVAYSANNNKENAISNAKISLELNPQFSPAQKLIQNLS